MTDLPPLDSEFENELRRLQPMPCSWLTEETFFRAGWEAALGESRNRTNAQVRRNCFSAGVLSGLAASILIAVIIPRSSSLPFSQQPGQNQPRESTKSVAGPHESNAIRSSPWIETIRDDSMLASETIAEINDNQPYKKGWLATDTMTSYFVSGFWPGTNPSFQPPLVGSPTYSTNPVWGFHASPNRQIDFEDWIEQLQATPRRPVIADHPVQQETKKKLLRNLPSASHWQREGLL